MRWRGDHLDLLGRGVGTTPSAVVADPDTVDTPIPGNWLQASGFHYEQHPSVRNVSFYLRGTDVFTFEPIHSMFCSFVVVRKRT